MTIKQNKNKIQLPDALNKEKYLVYNHYDSPKITPLNSPKNNEQNVIIHSKNKSTKKKSDYILFVQEATNNLKQKYPLMTAKERREEVLKLWKSKKIS